MAAQETFHEKSSRHRSCNFTSNEKSSLLNIIAKFKNIIENKKTDAVNNQQKTKAWDRIEIEFNAISPSNVNRTKDVLKRFYENKKKELRKRVADQKLEIISTGGGAPTKDIKDHSDDLLSSIMNQKTIYGLETQFGGDAESDSEVINTNQHDIEVEYGFVNDNTPAALNSTPGSPETYDLEHTDQLPSTSHQKTPEHQKNTEWAKHKPYDLRQNVSSPLKRKPLRILEENIRNDKTANSHPTQPLQSRRRRAVTVKALNSSDIAAKYNAVLDTRLDILNYQKQILDLEGKQKRTRHEKEMSLLDIQLEIEKEKLKKMKKVE